MITNELVLCARAPNFIFPPPPVSDMLGVFDLLITQKKKKKKETNLFTPKIDRLFLFPFDLLNFFITWQVGQGGSRLGGRGYLS